MSRSISDIISILSKNQIGLNCTYVGKNYTKADLIADLYVLMMSHPYSPSDFKDQPDDKVQPNTGIISKNKKKRISKVKKLIHRDGQRCFYCGAALSVHEITIEHFHAKSNGGTDAISNLRIACGPCNVKADNLPIQEKQQLRKQE